MKIQSTNLSIPPRPAIKPVEAQSYEPPTDQVTLGGESSGLLKAVTMGAAIGAGALALGGEIPFEAAVAGGAAAGLSLGGYAAYQDQANTASLPIAVFAGTFGGGLGALVGVAGENFGMGQRALIGAGVGAFVTILGATAPHKHPI